MCTANRWSVAFFSNTTQKSISSPRCVGSPGQASLSHVFHLFQRQLGSGAVRRPPIPPCHPLGLASPAGEPEQDRRLTERAQPVQHRSR